METYSERILLFGDVMLDEYWFGQSTRISPEGPIPITKVESIKYVPGGAANVAQGLMNLGESCQLIGITGKDTSGEILRTQIDQLGIRCHLYFEEDRPTVRKVRVISNSHYMARIDFEKKFRGTQIKDYVKSQDPKKIEWVILSDYNKGTLNHASKLIEWATAHNLKVLVDPKNKISLYKKAWLVKPNISEFKKYIGDFETFEDIINLSRKSMAENQIENFLVTLGKEGMLLINSKEHFHIPSLAQDVFDVTGAGDTVMATVGAFLAKSNNLLESARMASKAASIAIRKVGTYSVSLQEIMSTDF